jgi:pSer/pThr/pTyr-binding forkhead associated (FHA) protein
MPSPFSITITLHSGSLPEKSYVFDSNQTIVLGAAPTCGIVIGGRGVSRKHCQLEGTGQGWTMIDLGSTNGILLNGKAFAGHNQPKMKKPIPLTDGDELGIGDSVLKIQIESEPEQFTEILTPKQLLQGRDVQTEMLTPNQLSQMSTNANKQKQEKASKASSNPMHRPETVAIDSPRLPKSQKSQSEAAPLSPQPKMGVANSPSATKDFVQPTSGFALTVPGPFRNYNLQKRVGVGGMGEVFLAILSSAPKSSSNDLWAVKFLKPQAELSELDRARFVREMEITLTMQHSALIRCVDCGDENGQLFIVMDYCNGGNLHELLRRSGKLNVRRAVRLMDRLLAGVEFAHEKGIVHRDLKPSNILLHKDSNDKYLPKISDFGLAKSYLQAGESGMTVNGSVGGSWAYMPKEQLTNFRFVSPQSDVWSMGAILYECLTLKLPRPMEKGADPIRTILESKIIPLQEMISDIHPEISKFVMKCLAREPEQRYKDAGAMRAALKIMAGKADIEL